MVSLSRLRLGFPSSQVATQITPKCGDDLHIARSTTPIKEAKAYLVPAALAVEKSEETVVEYDIWRL